MNEELKFEPDPFTKRYIDYLDKSPIKFDNLKHQIESIRKSELTYNNTMTFTEEFEQLFKDSDIMKISGAVGMRTNDDKIAFCLGLEQKYINPELYTISKLDHSTYLLTNKDESKNDRWVVNFYKEMWYGTNHREIIK